jgi:hypothetical protein
MLRFPAPHPLSSGNLLIPSADPIKARTGGEAVACQRDGQKTPHSCRMTVPADRPGTPAGPDLANGFPRSTRSMMIRSSLSLPGFPDGLSVALDYSQDRRGHAAQSWDELIPEGVACQPDSIELMSVVRRLRIDDVGRLSQRTGYPVP